MTAINKNKVKAKATHKKARMKPQQQQPSRSTSHALFLLILAVVASTSSAATKGATPASTKSNLPVLYDSQGRQVTSSSYYSWNGDGSSSDAALARAAHVRHVLVQRLDHVSSGRRLRDIVNWIQKNNAGQATILSLHGVSNNPAAADLEILQDLHRCEWEGDNDAAIQEVISAKDPFSKNRMHLGLVSPPDAPPNMFPGPPLHVLDDYRPKAWQLAARAVRLGVHFVPVLSTSGLALVSQKFRQGVWYKWMASCIGSSGAAWIKWGQWSSTRNDMFPEALCRELSTLHADAPAHGFRFSRQQLESSLGLAPQTLEQVFDSFDPEPLASGSIAQVHKAELNGKLLAVKVRHPNVAQLIDMDFRLMSLAARIFDYVPGLRWLRIRDSVEQFSSTMAAQAHLHVEAYHLEILNYNFRNWKSIRFPEPFFASSSVIIETFEPGAIFGKIMDDFETKAQNINQARGVEGENGPKVEEPDAESGDAEATKTRLRGGDIMPFPIAKFIVTAGLNMYLKMLLVDNLMHADLHPGNIIYNMDHEKGLATSETARKALAMIHNLDINSHGEMSISLVDAGMVAQLTDEESSTFIGLLSSIGAGNGRDAAYFALQFSLENQMTPEEEEAFTNDMVELFEERCRGYGTNVDVGEVLRGILGLVRKHQLRVDANFATLVVNVLCLESLGRGCLPEYNVLDAARPLLETYRKLCYEPDGTPKPDVRKSKRAKLILSLMYARKTLLDKARFNRAQKERDDRIMQRRIPVPGQ